ncbi:E3 ubiquitin-protein ligase RMA1H1-like [Rutidosis leptorrhynchoides]|uniref:E3 ubiquitin-protein ligase RMA1H1-like n=1 Tax=Rutidosis leptorrhynchoides TaxID=125765 RepID=UPI003A99983A
MAYRGTPLFDCSEDASLNKNSKSVSENSTGFCECNICLDSARDPMVTLCGHLYCWPCIYKWLHVQTSSLEYDKQPLCPVCKAHISTSSLIPLYGRGNSPSSEPEPEPELKRAHQSGLVIPSRPPAPGGSISHLNQQIQPHIVNHPHPLGSYTFGTSNFSGPMIPTSVSTPFVGMFGEMVCAMIFRSSDSGFLAAYPYGSYQNPYPDSGASSPRVRRQVMQVEKSLNRLTIFFFCCFMLCLLLF